MIKAGVVKFNTVTRTLEQLYEDIPLSDAYNYVSKHRSKRDGNWYWVGTVENHRGLGDAL